MSGEVVQGTDVSWQESRGFAAYRSCRTETLTGTETLTVARSARLRLCKRQEFASPSDKRLYKLHGVNSDQASDV
jgi:hypothetical protein